MIALDPNYAPAYYSRGIAYGKIGNHQQAIKDLTKVIEIKPGDAAAYHYRGVSYYLIGNKGRAISDFQKACDMGNDRGCKGLQETLQKR